MPNDLVTRIPFAFARSGLFRPGNALPNIYANTPLPATLDYAIDLTSSGPPLRSCHALAWQALVALALDRHNGHLDTIEASPAEILRLMGRQGEIHTRARAWLRALLSDLCGCSVTTSTPIHSYVGPLLHSVTALPQRRLSVSFSPELDGLVQNEFVAVPLSAKNRLGAHPLAQWLHDYIATHRDTYVASVEAIHRMCGSSLTLSAFRARLVDGLNVLIPTSAALMSYTLDGDKLTLRKHKTTVVRLTQERVVAAKHHGVRQRFAVEQARMQRARVPL